MREPIPTPSSLSGGGGVVVDGRQLLPYAVGVTLRKPKRLHKKAGRPTAYDPRFDRIARKFALLGATDAQIADALGVTVTTLTNWKHAHPGFLAALKEGKDHADAAVVESLYRRATGFQHKSVKIMQYEGEPIIVPFIEKFAPDPTSMIFWLKNRRPGEWREKREVEHSGEVSIVELLERAHRAGAED